jgi:pSer/pThr/pTyr-binding forkhead associated (FHA) protein
MSANQALLHGAAVSAGEGGAVTHALEIVLEPLSHPDLGAIRIEESVFAIGRNEAPFASCTADAVADLSRRHARIFAEGGAAYIADLGSKNGTTVNGVEIREKMSRLRDGDVVRFGKSLSWRVRLRVASVPARSEGSRMLRLAGLALHPEHDGLGLQPIVVTSFPFLVSKTDAVFARYRDAHPEQVNYLSRRHAHLFLKDGLPFVEDLGSTNGTFINGKRLDEHAVPLKEGDVLAFGGHHFVYRVNLQADEAADLPTMTKLDDSFRRQAQDGDKTTFVAAADSFLDIFCIDPASRREDAVNGEVAASDKEQPAPTRSRFGRPGIFLAELARALSDGKRPGFERVLRWSVAALVTLAILATGGWLAGMPKREVRELLAQGDYLRAAQLASRHVAEDADGAEEFGALGVEALLKARLPSWMAALGRQDFAAAHSAVDDMKRLARGNAAAEPLVREVEWIDGVERFLAERGGPDTPPRDAADAARIRNVLAQWDENVDAQQGAFATIASHVPAFRDRYAETLSHLRKLALAASRKDGSKDERQDNGTGDAPAAAAVDQGSAGRS